MGGYGGQPMLVIKANRALLKKRKLKDIKEIVLEASGKTEVEFKKVSPIELARIKTEIRKKAKKAAHVQMGLLIACFAAVTVFLYWLFYM